MDLAMDRDRGSRENLVIGSRYRVWAERLDRESGQRVQAEDLDRGYRKRVQAGAPGIGSGQKFWA